MTNDNKTNLKADHGQNIDNKKTNNRKVVTMLNSNKTQSNIDAQFINDAQGFSITGLNLLNINRYSFWLKRVITYLLSMMNL